MLEIGILEILYSLKDMFFPLKVKSILISKTRIKTYFPNYLFLIKISVKGLKVWLSGRALILRFTRLWA